MTRVVREKRARAHARNERDESRSLKNGISRHPRDPMIRDLPSKIQKSKTHGVVLPTPLDSILINQSLTTQDSALTGALASGVSAT
jgi:hypothetical protein